MEQETYIEKGEWGYARTNKTRDREKEKFYDYPEEYAVNNGEMFYVYEDDYGEVVYFKKEENLKKYLHKIYLEETTVLSFEEWIKQGGC